MLHCLYSLPAEASDAKCTCGRESFPVVTGNDKLPRFPYQPGKSAPVNTLRLPLGYPSIRLPRPTPRRKWPPPACSENQSQTMQSPILAHVIAQPLQPFSLGAGGFLFTQKRRDQFHVRTQMRNHRDAPLLPASPFAFGRQIAHVRHDLTRPPRPALITVMQAGHQQPTLGNIGGRYPTDQRHEQDCVLVRTPPQAEAVLLVADKPAALTGLERAPTKGRMDGGVSAGVFF